MGEPPVPEDWTCVGALAGAFGVHGSVRLKSFCAEPRAIADYAPLLTGDGRSFGVRIERATSGALVVRLSGVNTREMAEALKGTRLYVPRARLPGLADEEYYHADLIGLAVFDTGGAEVGRVRAVLDHGAGDLIEVARPDAASVLLPFTRVAVPTVDLALGRIVVDPPPGLLDAGDD